MSERDFWSGFAAGAVAGVAGGLAGAMAWRAWRTGNQFGDVLRLEKTVQIGRPVDEVFAAWSNLSQLPHYTRLLREVREYGSARSHWVAEINGRTFEWDAELVQNVRNQALGWRSASGPKHTGRVTFSPLGDNTVVHVQMNYAPPLGPLGRAFLETFERVDQYIEQALRDFKAGLEGKGQEAAERRGTGTFGGRPVDAGVSTPPPSATQTSRFGNQEQTIEYTRPPEAKY